MTRKEEKQRQAIKAIVGLKKLLEKGKCVDLDISVSRFLKAVENYVVNPFKKTERVKKTERATINIALVGKFSSGKSTFINSILEKAIAPSSLNPTTRSITTFRYGKEMAFYDVKGKTLQKISKEEYLKAVQETHKTYLVEVPCKHLEAFSIIDTPGFNPAPMESADGVSDNEMSVRAVKNADVLFYLHDINKGTLGADGITYLQDILKNSAPKIYIILNYADKKWRIAEREAVKNSVKNECQQAKIQVDDVIEYSSLWDGVRPGWETRRIEGTSIVALREKMINLLTDISSFKAEILNARIKGQLDSIAGVLKEILEGEQYNKMMQAIKDAVDVGKKELETRIGNTSIDVSGFLEGMDKWYTHFSETFKKEFEKEHFWGLFSSKTTTIFTPKGQLYEYYRKGCPRIEPEVFVWKNITEESTKKEIIEAYDRFLGETFYSFLSSRYKPFEHTKKGFPCFLDFNFVVCWCIFYDVKEREYKTQLNQLKRTIEDILKKLYPTETIKRCQDEISRLSQVIDEVESKKAEILKLLTH